jgi:cation diffusion facilitator CzcD-associated flavoprotein CzcO
MAEGEAFAAEFRAATPGRIEPVDVLIVGAGLSGIGAAAHLQARLPGKRYAILEARGAIGGTWDLFRYPGIRSDSDMYTLGYRFRPWTEAKAIADGPSIRRYIEETATERGIDRHIRFGHRVVSASWSSAEARWTLEVEHEGERRRFGCSFLIMASGYYAYAAGHRPRWPGEAEFGGTIVHPQSWPEDLDYRGKKVVVIGSGATAMTLVPAMAETARHVTLLQRSPSYVVSRPSVDAIAEWLKRRLPARLAYGLARWKNVLLGQFFFRLARRRPERVGKRLIDMVRAQLGPAFDPRHFTPSYRPWDQRLYLVPDSDLFRAIRDGRASVVTDTIDCFTREGVRVASGPVIEADIVVTATGLDVQLFGGMSLSIDGVPADPSRAMGYKGIMLSGVPNLAVLFGYTNASWTLKVDLSCDFVCRLLRRMDRAGKPIAVARPDPDMPALPFLDFTSGYVRRALDRLPSQGARRPWRLYQNYALDLITLRFGRIEDGVLELREPSKAGLAVAASGGGSASRPGAALS